MTYLGMQIMVEGLALAAFGFMHQMTTEPLLKQLLRYVMSDEARHVAFGVLVLKEYYAELTRRRAARAPGVRLRGRGAHARPLPPAGGVGAHGRRPQGDRPAACMQAPERQVVPAAAVLQDRAQLQEARPARRQPTAGCATKFTELGVIQFEDWADTGEEYDSLPAAAADRAGRRPRPTGPARPAPAAGGRW